MGIKYVEVQEILKRKKIAYPEFGIFNDRGTVVKIAHWQPEGILSFLMGRGFFCNAKNHSQKAMSFLQYARGQNADIVITPEYSLPWECLQKIISDNELWPGYGKIWCLGMEGISCDSLKQFKDKNERLSTLCLHTEDFESLNLNSFFSCVAYVFRQNSKLICIIQFKTTAASDKWAELEACGLTTGNTIYYFKAPNSGHCMLAYICADALNQSISAVKHQVNYQKCIILHPQLNPNPLHDSFRQMRKSFLDYSKENIRIISVNWAKNSKLTGDIEQREIYVKDSYSACYYSKRTSDDVLQKMLVMNKSKGVDLTRDEHIYIWHMPSNEHCMFYTIDCFDTKELNQSTANHNEPLGKDYLEYDPVGEKWTVKSACSVCTIDWKWLEQQFHLEQCKQDKKQACEINKLHKFFTILFGKDTFETCSEGMSRVIFEKGYSETPRLIQARERGKIVDEKLRNGYIPPKFPELKNGNYKWILPGTGNIAAKTDETKVYNVMYIDSGDIRLLDRGIDEFTKIMGEAAKDKLLVYHFTSEGIKYYDDFYNKEINNPNLTKTIASIKE